jgi:NAD-dependent dihydropyrimidine dehydrogenase PreA subunit
MNILTMMWRNLWGGSRTLLFPGCAICRFRCTARAIEFRAGKGEFYWSYDPGQCTFCGRCVEGCKTHALSQDPQCPPVYLTIGELKNSYTVARKPPAPKPAPAAPPAVASTSNPAPGGTQ